MKNNGKLKKQKRCKTYKQQKDYLKWTSKRSHISQKTFGNDLAAIRKNKVTLTPNYSTESKYYDESNKLVVGKMKDETTGVAMEEFWMIKYTPKTKDVIDLFLVIRVNYKETVILITIQTRFVAKHIVLIFSLVRTAFLRNILNLKNTKHLKK